MPLLNIPRKGEHDMEHAEHAEHASMPSSGAARRAVSPWRAALVVIAVIPVILACASTARSLASAPASSLRVYIHFEQALVPGKSTKVTVIMEDEQGTYIKFTGDQKLSIDGAALDSPGSFFIATIPRQAPGENVYTFIYTDEHGHQTVVHIPGPREDFVVLAPTAGSQVPLPRPVGTGGPAVPTPTPNKGPQSDPNQPRPPALGDAPLPVRHTLPYPIDSLPRAAGTASTPNRYQVGLSASGPASESCASAQIPCPPIFMYQDPPTETTTIDDHSWPWGRGFETLAPGPGYITASVDVAWNMPQSGFFSCYVMFDTNAVSVPITWV